MSRTARTLVWVASLSVLVGLAGCDTGGSTPMPGRDGGPMGNDAYSPVLRCSRADDPDMDSISSMDESSYDVNHDGSPDLDVDMDGTPNAMDTDSDGDGLADSAEAGDQDCTTRPRDTDMDGVPDFLDLDSNNDGIPDAMQTTDTHMAGVIDALNPDSDGDGIPNRLECEHGAPCTDTDHDGMPDVFDLDSDADTIRDRDEGSQDPDGDMLGNWRDLDSDGDMVDDATEAGDGILDSPPVQCAREIDPTTVSNNPPTLMQDGLSDFVDADSDNDGLGDGDEIRVGTDPCNADSDMDGQGDLAEGAYAIANCPDGHSGTFCDIAHNGGVQIPIGDFFVFLPYHTAPVERDLEFGTSIRVADVFFLADTTGSMGGTINNVQQTIATPITGIIDRLVASIPDLWVGAGDHKDMPFSPYSSTPDEPFNLTVHMTPPDHAADVRTAIGRWSASGGGDGPESGTMALYQTVTGEGGTWTGSGGPSYTMRHYMSDCLDSGWGAPCFRDAALPIVIHFSDICQHNGPAGDCDDYVGISPTPPTWMEAVAAMNRRGARFVGVNASGGEACATVLHGSGCSSTGGCGGSPCWFMRQTAQQTGSIDLDGNELVYDLPNDATREVFTNTIVDAVETIATRVPLDITTRLRDDTTDPEMVDARRFIYNRTPACNVGIDPCWTEPTGVSHAMAVVTYDMSTFFGVVPGTRVQFRITFRNDFYPGDQHIHLFKAFIDVTAGGSAVLDTRQVYIVVPANPHIFG
jgi:hypothetical protein